MPYHLRPLWLHHIFRHYLINDTIFGKKVPEIKYVFRFSLHLLSKAFLMLRRSQRNIVENGNFLDTFSGKEGPISYFIKIRAVGAELFHVDRRTHGHDKADSRFSLFCERA